MAQVQTPSIPKGTRDFGPAEMIKRNYIFDTIKSVFKLYGFQQIETPATENLSTLMGKYGEEGDKLLFKILNSGDYLGGVDAELLQSKDSVKVTNKISEKGLRYDLTVPFARFVVQHRNDLQFPFKRYQIQPVWRADKPQKGRYREFYQCDVDIVGSDSLMNEVELIQIVNDVYQRFGIRVALKINNRKILAGIAEAIGAPDKMMDITVAIDKLDKIGIENVNKELADKGLSDDSIARLQPILALNGTNRQKLEQIANVLKDSEVGQKGILELQTIFNTIEPLNLQTQIDLDLTLARGLNYYTGAIFEVKALDVQIGSITGGGRYDDLTGIFGLKHMSGVGISFGADRICDIMEEGGLFPEADIDSTQLLLVNFGEKELQHTLPLAQRLRQRGIRVELYPDAVKIGRQFSYADARGIPYVAIIGEEEIAQGRLQLKNMSDGSQTGMTEEELITKLNDLK